VAAPSFGRPSAVIRYLRTQSGRSKSLHQPAGLISPLTSLQLRGRMKNVQPAQLNNPFGVF
jgi:hypothetical protein